MSDRSLPERVGPYAVTLRLGVGGMAEAFLAQREGDSLAPPVVVKRLLPHALAAPNSRELLLREGRVGLRLNHVNLVRYIDAGNDNDGAPWIAMEYLAGLSLGEFAERSWSGLDQNTPLVLAARIITDAARGLQFAHESGVIHRDVSPDNLLVTREGVTKLLDFGVVHASGERRTTQVGEIKGKVGFFPPEMLEGEAADARTDVFALGVTFYWLLGRALPFDGQNEGQILRAIMTGEPRPLRELNPRVPAALEEFITKMLAKSPDDRVQTALAVGDALEGMFDLKTSALDVGDWVDRLLKREPATQKTVVAMVKDTRENTGIHFGVLSVLHDATTEPPQAPVDAVNTAATVIVRVDTTAENPDALPATEIAHTQDPQAAEPTFVVHHKRLEPTHIVKMDEPATKRPALFIGAAVVITMLVALIAAIVLWPGEPRMAPAVVVTTPPIAASIAVDAGALVAASAPPKVDADDEGWALDAGPDEVEDPITTAKRKVSRRRFKPKRPSPLPTTMSAKLAFLSTCKRYRRCARSVLRSSKKLATLPLDETRRFPAALDRCVSSCLK